jgi:S1-C subfamily serine protease
MKTLSALVFFLLFISTAYAGGLKKIYMWVEYPKSANFRHGVSIKLNETVVAKLIPGELVCIKVYGDKKYKIAMLDDDDKVLAETKSDTLKEDFSYMMGSARGKNSTVEKMALRDKQDFMATRAYFRTFDAFEDGLNDDPIETSYGSCFLISPEGYIVTNIHVVENHRSIKIKGIEGNFDKEYEAEVAAKDEKSDLAVLRLKDKTVKFTTPPYALRTQGVNTGEDISVLGYPLGPKLGDEIKLTTGVISAKSGYKGNAAEFQISAPAQPGNSGGPLFDAQGYIIGVVYAKVMGAENITYAVKAPFVQTLVATLPEAHISDKNTIESQNLPQRVAACSKYIYIIKCE